VARKKREYTERWWLKSYDYTTMMQFMGVHLSRRKRLLFGCATARLVWDFVVQPCNRKAVLTSEAYADGQATLAELATAWHDLAWEAAMYSEWHIDALTAGLAYSEATRQDRDRFSGLDRSPFEVSRMQWSDALRDIAGNPFHEYALHPDWLDANDRIAAALAETAYDERAFESLPILADALEDAGCDIAAVLDHLRGPGPHFRGCWALDLILGKQ
jgi:hypothetical protein